MQKFHVTAQVTDGAGVIAVAKDGTLKTFNNVVSAGSAHTAVAHAVKSMDSRWDNVMQRYYIAPAKLAKGERLVIDVVRVD